MLKEFIAKFSQKIEERLSAKTGWGRNEILAVIKDCLNETLMEMLP